MSYEPTMWRNGDLITEDKLNNIEAGILEIQANINANFSMGPYGIPLPVYNLVVPIEVDQYTMLMTHPLPIRAAITKIAEEHKSSIDAAEERIYNALDNGASITEANADIAAMLIIEAGYSWKPDGTNQKLLLYRLNNGGATLIGDEETNKILSEELLNETTNVFVMKFFTSEDIYNLETIKIGNSPTDYEIYYPIPNEMVGSTGSRVFDMILAPLVANSRVVSSIVFAETTIDSDDVPSITAFLQYSDESTAQ